MIDYKEKYYELWGKFLELSLRDSWLIDERISAIDKQIKELTQQRKILVARKHREAKERIDEKEKIKKILSQLPQIEED